MALTDTLPLIRKLMDRQDLSAEETRGLFKQLASEDTNGYFFLVFIVALHTKGETADELLGLCRANADLVPKVSVGVDPEELIDLSGSGGAKLKTINVSTAASFIVAGAGVKVAKLAAFGVTSLTGSANIFDAFGIDIFKVQPEQIKEALRKIGLTVYYYPAFSPKLANRNKLVKGVFVDQKLGIKTPFHLMSFIFAPISMRRRIYGVYDEKYLNVLTALLQKLGYTKGLVFHGVGGLCEVSNIGPTKIVEFNKADKKEYTVMPTDFGLEKARYEDIKAISADQNIIDFLRIIYNKETGPKRDIILANAAVALYVMDKASNFKEGAKLARRVLEDGKAALKLEQLVEYIGDVKRLSEWKRTAKIA